MTVTGSRHASNLELFLDLVFVFSVTQVTSFVASNQNPAGLGKGALLGFLVWWQWTGFTWAGTAIDLQSNARARVLVLAMVPAMLVMAVTVPESLHGEGRSFAVAYLVVQLLVLTMQAFDAFKSERTRKSFLRYAPLAAVAPTLLLIGGFLSPDARLVTWIVVAVAMVGSGLAAVDNNGGEWAIDPTHFAERHALFVIITLGEVVVGIGATAASLVAEHGLEARVIAAIVVAAAVACVLWWSYFGFVPAVIEKQLDEAAPAARGVIARDVGSYGHFPLVFGLMLFAVVAEHLLEHPDGHLEVADRWMLAVSMITFIGAQLIIQFRLVRRLAPERFAAVAVVCVLAALGDVIPGTVVVGLTAMVLAAMAVVTARRFRSSELGRAVHHSV